MESNDDDIPNEFLCPITLEIMREPMVFPDGHTYEKEAIKMALEKTHRSPLTKVPMEFSEGVINYSLKSLIEAYVKDHNINLNDIDDKIKNLEIKEEEAISVKFKELQARFISGDKSSNLCKDSIHVTMKPEKIKTSPPVCLICVVDISGSMNVNCAENVENLESIYISRLELIKHSIKTIISTLRKEDMISVITFSTSATLQVKPTLLIDQATKDSVISELNSMDADGATNMWAGIKLALDTSSSIKFKNYQKSIMVFTDGDSNTNPPKGVYQTLKETLKVCDDKFTISTFSYGNDVGPELLIDIANLGNGVYGYCPDGTMVGTIFINYMANLLSTITPVAKVILTQGEKIKKTMTIGPLYRGVYRNAIFKVDRNLLSDTKVVVELPMNNQVFDVPLNVESADVQAYMDEMSKLEMVSRKDSKDKIDGNDDDEDEILDEESDEEETVVKLKDINTDAVVDEKDSDPVKYEEVLLNQIIRNKFLITLNKLLDMKNLGFDSDENNKAKKLVQDYLDLLKKLSFKTKFIKNLIIDISSPDPNHGQVEKAIDMKYYGTWGKSYLSSFLRFHQFEQCGNFKDLSLQYYSHDIFSTYRKMANTLFINLPPPKILKNKPLSDVYQQPLPGVRPVRTAPLRGNILLASTGPAPSGSAFHGRPNRSFFSSFFGGGAKSSKLSMDGGAVCCEASAPVASRISPPPPTSSSSTDDSEDIDVIKVMSSFLNRHGGCFDGEAVVLLAEGKTKSVKDLKKGDQLRNGAVVQCLVEQSCHSSSSSSSSSSKPYMCPVKGVYFTPYHPILIDGTWYFPKDLVQPQPVMMNSWYNLVLDDDHNRKYEVEFQNGVKAITLGHYRTENDILRHPYFGTDAVLKDLKERDPEGYRNGYIYIHELNPRHLQYDENHYCINYYKLASPFTTSNGSNDDNGNSVNVEEINPHNSLPILN